MGKIISIILLSLITTTSFAGISVYDSIKTNQGIVLDNKACKDGILQLDRGELRIKELEEKRVTLSQMKQTKIFYHYTRSKELLQLLVAKEQDRSKAQSMIVRNGGLEEILKFSYNSNGNNLVGRGLYLAGNAFSSMEYGHIQTSYKLKDNTQIIETDFFQLSDIVERFLVKHNLFSSCRSRNIDTLLMTMLMQESGVDLAYYDEDSDYYMLVDEEVIEETDVIKGIRSELDLINKMLDADRMDELKGQSLALKCPTFKNCHKKILDKIILHENLNFIPPFIHTNIKLGHWKKVYSDISSAFNRNLKAKNVDVVDALLLSSCAPNGYGDRRITLLADYLIEQAPGAQKNLAESRRQAVCP